MPNKIENKSENKSENEIIIDLQESSNAKGYDAGNRVHQREFANVVKIIDKKITCAIKYSENKNRTQHRQNDAISILGSRGSGKTSFMLSVLENYKADDNKDIQVLPVVDPTLIEEKGHILLVIISLIQKCVQEKLNVCDCNPHSETFHRKNEWKELLHKLSAGLPTLDGVGGQILNESNWQDAEYVMSKGLKAVNSAFELEANFNKALELALRILNKKAFIIALDDIDVDFQKGWPVLETLRKYLTSPQLIILISGDLKLYSKAIRKQQWKSFGKALLINEADKLRKNTDYNELVTEMESQYLQKVLKPENRIHLTTLYDKIHLYKERITVKLNNNKEREIIELFEYYKDILKLLGIHNQYQAETYYSYLMTLPVRTQFQFLLNFEKLKLNDNVNLSDAFLSDLYEEEVDIQLATNLPKMLNVIILKLLLKERNLDEAYQLQPTTSKQSLNSSLIALSFLFSKHVSKNPFLIFDYIIKIGYIRNLLTVLDYHEITDSTYTKPTVEGLCRHSGILQDKVLRDILGNINAYIESNPIKKERKNNDVIYLSGSSIKNKGSVEESLGRIDFIFSSKRGNIRSQDQTLAFIPISTSSYLHYNSSSTVYSLYTLIATIGELMRKYELDDLENGFNELSQWRTYPMIAFDKGFTSLSEIEDYPGVNIKKDNSGNTKIIKLFSNWCSKYKEVEVLSPHLLGKIATRIYYTVNNISNHNESNEDLGIAMHRRIVAFMNAVLVEDVREHINKTQGLDISNAVTSDGVFINNIAHALTIKKYEKSKVNLSLSRWLLSCPLFLLYLNQSLFSNESFKSFTGIIDTSEISNSNIFELLSLVVLKDKEKKKPNLKTDDNISRNKPMFRSSRETERKKVLEVLISNKISPKLFRIAESMKEQMKLNEEIRVKCKGLFDEEYLFSDQLRNFRNYIDKNNNELLRKWKQAQS